MIYAGILAGGIGSRMGNVPMPKQFLLLNDKPILVHTIEKFVLNSQFKKIIIAVPHEWLNLTNDVLKRHALDLPKISVVVGGKDRNSTIMNIIDFIEQTYGISEVDVLVTHDAVRPFLTHRIIEENISEGLKHTAVNTVIPAIDTIVESVCGETVHSIPLRDHMYQGQTPQTFNVKKIKELYEKLTDEEKESLTDGCKIFSLKGEQIKLVQGEIFNMKVTTPFDLKIANAILKESVDT